MKGDGLVRSSHRVLVVCGGRRLCPRVVDHRTVSRGPNDPRKGLTNRLRGRCIWGVRKSLMGLSSVSSLRTFVGSVVNRECVVTSNRLVRRNRLVGRQSFVVPSEVRKLLFAGSHHTLCGSTRVARHDPWPSRQQRLQSAPQSSPFFYLLFVSLRRRRIGHLVSLPLSLSHCAVSSRAPEVGPKDLCKVPKCISTFIDLIHRRPSIYKSDAFCGKPLTRSYPFRRRPHPRRSPPRLLWVPLCPRRLKVLAL